MFNLKHGMTGYNILQKVSHETNMAVGRRQGLLDIAAMNTLNLICAISVLFFVKTVHSDIVGCGGFVKSHVSIDLTRVNVKLLTKHGVHKDVSDCAPNNGYYLIPLYDKGDYILKLAPPDGWIFEPESVPIHFNGVVDPCIGKDINFRFKGFTLSGKVTSRGSEDGPEEVAVIARAVVDESIVRTELTGKNGSFEISPVLPGEYTLTAQHSTFHFTKKSIEVTVDADSVVVPRHSLVIAGFDVTGTVVSNNEPVKGVTLLLYSTIPNQKQIGLPTGCDPSVVEVPFPDYMCRTLTDSDGKFVFTSVPSGHYLLRPFYATFEVSPINVDFTIRHAPFEVPVKFKVWGFSVRGRVLANKDGRGIEGVSIHVGNKKVITNLAGNYVLDGMESGTYNLSAQSDDYEFPMGEVRISPSTPDLEPIIAQKLRVCGQVQTISDDHTMPVAFKSSTPGAPPIITQTKRSGHFCQMLDKGRYEVSVYGSQTSQFIPSTRDIVVDDELIRDLNFSQLRATISGRLIRLPRIINDKTFVVRLVDMGRIVEETRPGPEEEFYIFHDVPPGNYKITIDTRMQCYEETEKPVTVSTAEVNGPTFEQKGFYGRITSSHATSCNVLTTDGDKVLTTFLIKGENDVCLPDSGTFLFEPIGCHGYEVERFAYDIGKEGAHFYLQAISHDVSGSIHSPFKDPIYVEVSSNGHVLANLGPLKGKKVNNGPYETEFIFRGRGDIPLEFTAKAPKVVFTSEPSVLQPTNDCAPNAVVLTGNEGMEIAGRVDPPLKDVRIIMQLHVPPGEYTTTTNEDGAFTFGPFNKNAKYTLIASKESYVMSGPDAQNVFQAHRLAQVRVIVVDNSTQDKLPGVLLSLTGGENYRKNSLTEDNGERVFNSLNPGEYFLRPMMKEYKFLPSSVVIRLTDGESKVLTVKGKRVSFSVFGLVSSLSGETEGGVAIEAIGMNACSGMVEEGVSDGSGHFRIRGLLPTCEYHLQIKSEPASKVYRIAPPNLIIKASENDVRDVDLVAFQRVDRVDASVHVSATFPDHLKTLTLKLAKEDTPDFPVHVIKLDTIAGGVKQWGNAVTQERFLRQGVLVQLPFVPRDGSAYIVTLESSLSKNSHSFTEPSVKFIADIPYQTLRVKFEAGVRIIEQDSPRHLVAGLALAIFFFVYWQVKKGWTILQTLSAWKAGRQELGFNRQQDGVNLLSSDQFTKKKGKPRKA